MKYLLYLTALISFSLRSQSTIDTVNQEMVSMSHTIEKPFKVGSVYYKRGENTPFTGVLFGKYENGNYLSIQEYKNGVGNGLWINYYPDGTIEEKGTYKNNRVEGPVWQYYPNGSLKAQGQYEHWRKKVGRWKFYDPNGKLKKTVIYPS